MSSTESYQTPGNILSFLTNSAVVKNLGAKLAAGREIDEAGAGERIVGVIQDTETGTGVDVSVVTGPCFKLVTSGAAFSDLDPLAVDAAGKFVTATAGTVVVAIAMAAAGGADENVLALILPMSQYRIASASVVDLTDSTGYSATHDDTLAATTIPAITATNPAAITAAAGEATAADLTLTQGLETTVSALVVDVAAILAVLAVMAQNTSDTAPKVKELIAVLDAQASTL
jgi:hypothetical protein